MIQTKRAPRPKRDAQQLTTRLNNQGRTRRPLLAIRNNENGYPIVLTNRDRGHKYEL